MIYLHCNIGQQVRSWTRTVAATTRPVRSLVYSVGSTLDLSKLISFKICWSWMLFCRSCPDFERIKADGQWIKTASFENVYNVCCCMLSLQCLTFASKGQAGPQRCDLSEGDVSGSLWQYVALCGSECDSMREVIQQIGLEFVNVLNGLNVFELQNYLQYDVGQHLASSP